MTINHKCKKDGCYVETLPDWAMLRGCFPPVQKDLASDIDGIVHQNGHCLFLEKKRLAAFINKPQMRMIRTLVSQGNAFIVFWGDKADGSDISSVRIFGINGYDSTARMETGLDGFRKAVNTWWLSVYDSGKV